MRRLARGLAVGLALCAAALIGAGVLAPPAAARQEAGQTTVELSGMCRGLVVLGVNADARCQPDLTLKRDADGQVHFAVAVFDQTCCALVFSGRTSAYYLDGAVRIQPIDSVFLYRAGSPPISEQGQGDCRWPVRTPGRVTLTCRLVSAHDAARVTQLVFDADTGEAFYSLFEVPPGP